MDIQMAVPEDIALLKRLDKHIGLEALRSALAQERVYVAKTGEQVTGYLRWGMFWDSIPFLNMLYVMEENRRQGIGRQLVAHWEAAMRAHGHDLVMTSTAADESAQHFYYKLGYETVGGFFHRDDPYELLLSKQLISRD